MAEILTDDGKSLRPEAFKLESVTLYNYRGDEKVIDSMISSMVVRESLHLPSMILEMTITDVTNFLEDFGLSGQERIVIQITKHPIFEEEGITRTLEFYITEYSDFAKDPARQNVQAYRFKGIAPYAYNSKFQKISRAYSASSTTEILKIMNSDLGYPSTLIEGVDATTHTGIITTQEPLSAIEYLRKTAYDKRGAPFFFYQTFDGIAKCSSLSYLADEGTNPVYNTYVKLNGYYADPNTVADYKERAARILTVKSDLEMSKVFQGVRGAYASKNYYLDITNKSYKSRVFDFAGEDNYTLFQENTLNKQRKVLSDSFQIGKDNTDKLNKLPDSHHEYIATNPGAFGTQDNYSIDLYKNIDKLNSYSALLESITNTITLHGDFNLNAGRKIKLVFPKAIQSDVSSFYNDANSNDNHEDKILSGNYLIVSVNHTFKFSEDGNSHYCSLNVAKDTIVTTDT